MSCLSSISSLFRHIRCQDEAYVSFLTFFQLSLEKGQHVKILQKSNESWWWAELNGCQGYVPVNHLTAESPQQAYWQDEEYFGSYSSLVRHFK